MPTLSFDLLTNNYLITETYSPEDFARPETSIAIFGSVSDSEHGVIDSYSFQLKFGSNVDHDVQLNEKHIYIGVNWPITEVSKLETQLLTNAKIKFGILLETNKTFQRGEHDHIKCKLKSIIKAIGT